MPINLFSQESENQVVSEKVLKVFNLLNQAQKKAVETIEGPVLVVAGPGTGKTQILAARIANILLNTDTEPHNILCLTYTDAGTIAMRKRLHDFIGKSAYNVGIYTFHGFCNEVIQDNLDYFGKRELEPISELEHIQLLERLIDTIPNGNPLKRYKGDLYFYAKPLMFLFKTMKEENWGVETVHNRINDYLKDLPLRDGYIYKRKTGAFKSGDVNVNKIKKEEEKLEKLKAAAALFPSYRQLMLDMNRYDYSDMIVWVMDAFKNDENLLKDYQERFHYFLVDEFQDTNGSQNEILQLLSGFWDVPNVFVVGDDDQSIYEFQGARIKNITDFYEQHQKSIQVISLEKNYRSTQSILDVSKALIYNNQDRLINQLKGVTKQLEAGNDTRIQSNVNPQIIEYGNQLQEEAGVLSSIEELQQKGIPLNEVAILYFKHKQAEALISLCEKRRIPYQVRKKINILETPLVRSLLEILTYINTELNKPFTRDDLLFKILHFRYFGNNALDIAKVSFMLAKKRKETNWRALLSSPQDIYNLKLKNPDALIDSIQLLENWILDISNITLQYLLEKIINESGLLKYIMQEADQLYQLQLINSFFDFVKNENAKNPDLDINRLLETIQQMENHGIPINIIKSDANSDGVNFITAHSSKGLEFKYVYLIGCTKDMWEGSRAHNMGFTYPDTLTFSSSQNKLETARRLFYVAITRAEVHLQISYAAKNKEDKLIEPSQFINECLESDSIQKIEGTAAPDVLRELQLNYLQLADKPNQALIQKEFLDAFFANYKMSVTHLNKYLKCPVTFYYENVLRVPSAKNANMAFGNAVHYAMNKLFTEMRNKDNNFPPGESLVQYFEQSIQYYKDHFTEQEYDLRLAYGKEILPQYYDHYVRDWNKITALEYPIRNIEVRGVPITGVLDKVEFNGNKVTVVDYKTGNPTRAKNKVKPPDDKEPLGGDYWRQVIFYKILLNNHKEKTWDMVAGEIDFIEPDADKNFKKYNITVDQEGVALVTDLIQSTYKNIMDHNFSQGCGKDDCYWCNFAKNKINQNELPPRIEEFEEAN